MNYFGTFVYELGVVCVLPGIFWLLNLLKTSLSRGNIGLFIYILLIFNTGLPPMAAIFSFFLFFQLTMIKEVNDFVRIPVSVPSLTIRIIKVR